MDIKLIALDLDGTLLTTDKRLTDENRDALLRAFDEACAKTRSTAEDAWKKVDIARGMAVYDPDEDKTVDDVARRADKLMYENKWLVKGMKTEQ